MSSNVKLTCRGTAQYVHPVRTVAQFRWDDGWGRVHNREKRDSVVLLPDGELSMVHHLWCSDPRCQRSQGGTIPTELLYSLLDYAREHGGTEVPLG